MRSFALFALQALIAASSVSAQEVVAEAIAYNSDSCGEDPNDPDLISHTFTVLKDANEIKYVDGEKVDGCAFGQFGVPGWPKEGSNYKVWIDQNTIPKGCELIFFNPGRLDDALPQGKCFNYYQRVPSNAACSPLTLPDIHGYSLCCGDACKVKQGDFPSKNSKARSVTIEKEVRDVTKIKKTAPLERLSQRDTCAFNSEKKEAVLTYGEQVQVSNEIDCTVTECTDGVDFTYESSTTNTFGVSAELGGELFKALTASISFSQEHSESKSKSFTMRYDGGRPEGSKGFITFTPRMECSPSGTWSGDCKWKKDAQDIEGKVCFPMMRGELPEGLMTFVRTN